MKFTTLTALFSLATAYPTYEYVVKYHAEHDFDVWANFQKDVPAELQEQLYNNWLAHIDEWTYFRSWERDYYDVILTENLTDDETSEIYVDVIYEMIDCAQPYGLVPSDWKAKNDKCVGGNIFEQLANQYEAKERAEYRAESQAQLLENAEKKPARYLELKQEEAERAARIASGEEVQYGNDGYRYQVVRQFQKEE